MSQGEGTVVVERSLRALDTLSPGPEQVAAAERAVALADEHGTPNQQIQARINLIAVYETSRPGEHELPHLSWLLNQLRDAGPALTERQRFEVLWECRFALARTRRSARIPLKIVRRVYADIEKRYRTEGVSPNLYAKHRALLARDTDTPEVARRWLAAWMESPRDKLSDCAACDQAEQARAMAADGDYEGALGHAAELLDGNRRCGEEPHRLYGRAADWSMRLGLVDQAEHYHRLGWPLVAGQGRFAAAAADHLIYLARAGRSGRAVRLALQVQPFVGDALDDFDRMYTAAILTRVFRFARGHQMLPPQIGDQPSPEVLAELDGIARKLAEQFDARNATVRVSERIAEVSKLAPYSVQPGDAVRHVDALERALLGAPMPKRRSRVARPSSILEYADALYFASDALDAQRVSSLIEQWMGDRERLLPGKVDAEFQAVAYLDRRSLASRAARSSDAVVDALLDSAGRAAQESEHEATYRRLRIEMLHRAAMRGSDAAWGEALKEVHQLEVIGELEEAASGLMSLSRHPDPATGVALAQRASELFRRAGKVHWEATALQGAGYSAAFFDPHLAVTLLDRAFALAREADRPQLAVAICATQGKAAWLRGDTDQAAALYAEAVAGADRYGATDPFALRSEYAEVLVSNGKWPQAKAVAVALADQAAARGDRGELAVAARFAGLVAHHMGDEPAAIEALEPAQRALADDLDAVSASAYWALGSAWASLGRPDCAFEPLAEAARLFGAKGGHEESAAAHEAAGAAAQDSSRLEEAAAHFATAAQIQRRLGAPEKMIGSLTGLASVFSADGRPDDALATLATAMGEARDLSDMSIGQEEQLLGRLELQAAQVLSGAGREAEANDMLEVADQRLSGHGTDADRAALQRVRALVSTGQGLAT